MKVSAFRFAVLALLIGIIVPSVGGVASAQRREGPQDLSEIREYRSAKSGFRFSYPPELEIVQAPYAKVVVALGYRDSTQEVSGFPTFNVTMNPGDYEFATLATYSKRIQEEYRLVGFGRVSERRSFFSSFAGGVDDSPVVQLSYYTRGEWFEALVAVVPAKDRYFVLTYIDKRNDYDLHSSWRRLIFKSFSLKPLEGVGIREATVPLTRLERRTDESQWWSGWFTAASPDDTTDDLSQEVRAMPQSTSQHQQQLGMVSDLISWFYSGQAPSSGFGLIGVIIAIAGFLGLRRTSGTKS